MVYDFGLRLKDLRKSKGISQKQLANLVEVSETSISNYENNLALPGIETIKAFAVLFRVSADYLLGLEPPKSVILDVDGPEEEQFMRQAIDCLQLALKKLKK